MQQLLRMCSPRISTLADSDHVRRLLALILLTLAACQPLHAADTSDSRAARDAAREQMEKDRAQLKADRQSLDDARKRGQRGEIERASNRVRASQSAYNRSHNALRDTLDPKLRIR